MCFVNVHVSMVSMWMDGWMTQPSNLINIKYLHELACIYLQTPHTPSPHHAGLCSCVRSLYIFTKDFCKVRIVKQSTNVPLETLLLLANTVVVRCCCCGLFSVSSRGIWTKKPSRSECHLLINSSHCTH